MYGDQLASLKQGPPTDESVPPLGLMTGVGFWETKPFSDPHKKARSHMFCMRVDLSTLHPEELIIKDRSLFTSILHAPLGRG